MTLHVVCPRGHVHGGEQAACPFCVDLAPASDQLVAWFVAIDGPAKGQDFRLLSATNRLGSDPSMEVSLSDGTIARSEHASIVFDARLKACVLRPAAGRVAVNGREVGGETALAAFDRVVVGESTLLFVPFVGVHHEWATVAAGPTADAIGATSTEPPALPAPPAAPAPPPPLAAPVLPEIANAPATVQRRHGRVAALVAVAAIAVAALYLGPRLVTEYRTPPRVIDPPPTKPEEPPTPPIAPDPPVKQPVTPPKTTKPPVTPPPSGPQPPEFGRGARKSPQPDSFDSQRNQPPTQVTRVDPPVRPVESAAPAEPPHPVVTPQQVAPAPSVAAAPVPPTSAPPAQAPPVQPPPSAAPAYSGPTAGTLSCPPNVPVVQNAEVVFRNLPAGRISLSLDQEVWEARVVPGEGDTQRVILRNKKPGVQKKCSVAWRLVP